MSALDAGYDVRSSGVTIDRFCGSGISAVNLAAACIIAGAEDLVVAGGTEMMSMNARRGDGAMVMDQGNLRLRPPPSTNAPRRLRRCDRDARRHRPRDARRTRLPQPTAGRCRDP